MTNIIVKTICLKETLLALIFIGIDMIYGGTGDSTRIIGGDMNGIRSSNIAVVKKRKSTIDRIYNKLKTIIEENPNRSYSNVAINTNRNRNYNDRNYNEPKFTPRVDPNNGLNTNNNFTNNNSRSTPDITTRPSGTVLMKGRK